MSWWIHRPSEEIEIDITEIHGEAGRVSFKVWYIEKTGVWNYTNAKVFATLRSKNPERQPLDYSVYAESKPETATLRADGSYLYYAEIKDEGIRAGETYLITAYFVTNDKTYTKTVEYRIPLIRCYDSDFRSREIEKIDVTSTAKKFVPDTIRAVLYVYKNDGTVVSDVKFVPTDDKTLFDLWYNKRYTYQKAYCPKDKSYYIVKYPVKLFIYRKDQTTWYTKPWSIPSEADKEPSASEENVENKDLVPYILAGLLIAGAVLYMMKR